MNTHTFECPNCGAVSHNPNDGANLYCGRCHRFFRILAPGLIADDQGSAYLSLPQLLAAYGFEDTPENREALVQACRERSAELGNELEIFE